MSTERQKLDLETRCCQQNPKNITTPSEIKRIDAGELSYNEFFWNYMYKNIPVIITSTSENWSCRTQWISDAKVNFGSLKTQIKNVRVPVANCSKEFYNSHEKCEMDFHEYLDYWEHKPKDVNENTLYLKDWHLKANMPDYDFYKVPEFFASDWLNEFLIDNNKDDYRFVYMGPEGSWTPFHADVFSSFSWSTNIFGLKKWIFVVPHDEFELKDALGNDPFQINEALLTQKGVRFFTVFQKENESIFVPSGWYHQVWNVTDTISINHNWFNGCNIDQIWRSLTENMRKVIAEIEDCSDMDNFEDHCQTMLRATFGINFPEFLEILEHVALKRRKNVENGSPITLFDMYELGDSHVLFDLMTISNLAKLIKVDKYVQQNEELVARCNALSNLTEIHNDFIMNYVVAFENDI